MTEIIMQVAIGLFIIVLGVLNTKGHILPPLKME